MKELSFYDQLGVVLPGAVVLLTAAAMYHPLASQFGRDGVSVGGLGLFVLVAYAVGHAVASLGNLFEKLVWLVLGGQPSEWVRIGRFNIMPHGQRAALADKVKLRYGLQIADLSELSNREWEGYFQRIRREVVSDRVDTFIGIYGLSRGLVVASVLIAVAVLFERPLGWPVIEACCGGAIAIFITRMVRFARYLVVETLYRFLAPTIGG